MEAVLWPALLCFHIHLLSKTSGIPVHHESVHKRQTVPEYKVDLLAIADWKLFDHWVSLSDGGTAAEKKANAATAIRQYISLVFDGVNMRYANIPDYLVSVRLVDIVIFQDQSQDSVTPLEALTGFVNANSTLYKLRDYTRTHQLQNHDHVMLFTGHDIFSTDNGALFRYTTGLAFVGTMCDPNEASLSVVEDRGGFQSVHTAAHELAHSLNAHHDGTQNSCSLTDRYIMAGTPSDITDSNSANPWYFSQCSITEMSSYISATMTTSSTCLKYNLPVAPGLPDVSTLRAGQLYDPDVQCRHLYGETSYYCRGPVFGVVEDICYSMFCNTGTSSNNITCNQHHAADYSSCGDRKWCVNGRCVTDAAAPRKDDNCVFGDEPSRQINHKTCSELLSGGAHYCYQQTTQDYCCGSCSNMATGVQGCEYGDRLLGCDSTYCNIVFPNGTLHDVTCCGTCNYSPNEWTCTDSASVPGLDCTAVKGHNCYNWTVAFHCCASCSALRTVENKGCEYGDKYADCTFLTSNGKTCDTDPQAKSLCCETCRDDETSGTSHVTLSGAVLFVCLTLLNTVLHLVQLV